MKRIAPIALLLLFSLIGLTGFCQNNNPKPKQFSNIPETINCNEQTLANIFNSSIGQPVVLNFSNDFTFSGNMTSKVMKYANLQTAVILSPDYNNTLFTVSRITNADGSYSYVGRIINKNFFDGFELKKNNSGNYLLSKIETDRVIPDCL